MNDGIGGTDGVAPVNTDEVRVHLVEWYDAGVLEITTARLLCDILDELRKMNRIAVSTDAWTRDMRNHALGMMSDAVTQFGRAPR